jgi:hypothetical protein
VKPKKGHSFFYESNGIRVVDLSTTSLPKTENTSPVSSVGSPTQDDARRALDLVWSFFQNQPAGILELDEYAAIGKLMVKLRVSHGPDKTPVLSGGIYPSVKEEND